MPAIQNIRNTSPARGPGDLDGLRVLIVEDSWHVSTGLRRLLEGRGATVDRPVATTADAMRLVSESTPDVALVDINLRDGELSYELIDWLQDRGIRIVVLTGYADISLQEGKVAAILQKPARDEVLIASLREPE
jgi:ActR/RegA family two-component response regulator